MVTSDQYCFFLTEYFRQLFSSPNFKHGLLKQIRGNEGWADEGKWTEIFQEEYDNRKSTMEITFHTHNTQGEERWKPYRQTQLKKVVIFVLKQGCIPVGCIVATCYSTGGLPNTEPPEQRPPDRDLLDRDPPDRDPLDRDPPDRDPLDRDPPGQRPLDRDPPCHVTCGACWYRDPFPPPPRWTEFLTHACCGR